MLETIKRKYEQSFERIKNSKVVRALTYAFKVKIVLQTPALTEGRGEQNQN